jgi:hypothetical protein
VDDTLGELRALDAELATLSDRELVAFVHRVVQALDDTAGSAAAGDLDRA